MLFMWCCTFTLFIFLLDDDGYLKGNYITATYGSRDTGGPFDAVQVETPIEMRADEGEEGRERFGKAVARAMTDFYRMYYSI